MKVLILGGTGFIGRHLTRSLASTDYDVLIAVRTAKHLKEAGGTNTHYKLVDYEKDESILAIMEEVDTIIYLIGQMGKEGLPYADYYRTNCTLTKRILLLACNANVEHFIYFSTPGVQGFGKRLCKESDGYAPRNAYEKTKMLSERMISDICKEKGMHYTILRPDFVYGPGDYRRVAMYRNIKEKKFVLTVSGKSYLHPTYVSDVVQGVLLCIGNPVAFDQTYNLAAEKDVTSRYYLECIAKATGSRLVRVNIGYYPSVILAQAVDSLWHLVFHKEGFVTKNRIDFLALDHSSSIEKAKRELGYAPEYGCREGITETIQWCVEKGLL